MVTELPQIRAEAASLSEAGMDEVSDSVSSASLHSCNNSLAVAGLIRLTVSHPLLILHVALKPTKQGQTLWARWFSFGEIHTAC